MPENVAIAVKQISKSFKLPHEKNTSIKSAVLNFYKRKSSFEKQQVLEDISFEIKKGEFFGIVGRNGSGKSTLLKLLAGIYSPDEGTIKVNGKLTPFIELGVGFNPELTGRENVFLNGALLGFSRKEMNVMYEDIVTFAELDKFMDQKLKNYSSGMQVRLAFSIAIRAKSDILLIDEVLAVGDTAFQKKCYEVFTNLKKQGRTIVFVTHDMSAVERFCSRAMVVHKGEIKGIVTPSEASTLYDELNADRRDADTKLGKKRWGSGEVKVEELQFLSGGKPIDGDVVSTGKELELRLSLVAREHQNITVGLAFEDVFGVNISGPNSIGRVLNSKATISYHIDQLPLLPGDYKVTVVIYNEAVVKEFDHLDRAATLRVKAGSHSTHGKVDFFGTWEER